MSLFPQNCTIVLVHGAWADGSCWSNVILPLQRQGLNVICAPIPLTSLTNDITALNRVLERTSGPVVLAGHAYAGAVIAGTTEKRVKSLVYVAALAPDQGETVAKVFYRDEPHLEAPKVSPRIRTASYGWPWMGFAARLRIVRRRIKQSLWGPCNTTDRTCVYSRTSSGARVENKTLMVLAGGRGPHDPTRRHAALHGRADGGEEGQVAPCGPHSDVHGSEPGDRRDLRGRARNHSRDAARPCQRTEFFDGRILQRRSHDHQIL